MATPGVTMTDNLWSALFVVFVLVCLVGGTLAGAACVPYFNQLLDTTGQTGLGRSVQGISLLGGAVLGGVIAFAFMVFISRRFISIEIFDRWQQQHDAAKARLPYLHNVLVDYLMRVMRPR